jgi:hypothetical protein
MLDHMSCFLVPPNCQTPGKLPLQCRATEPYMCLVIDTRAPTRGLLTGPATSVPWSAHIIQPGSVTLDIGKAYLCSAFMGCRRSFTQCMLADCFAFHHIWCMPEDCGLNCSKCMHGFQCQGQYFAFNCPMFGGKVIGNILDWMLALVDLWVQSKGIPMLRWVDNYMLALGSPAPNKALGARCKPPHHLQHAGCRCSTHNALGHLLVQRDPVILHGQVTQGKAPQQCCRQTGRAGTLLKGSSYGGGLPQDLLAELLAAKETQASPC